MTVPCNQSVEPCDNVDFDFSVCDGIYVCGNVYDTIEQAWKVTKIPPYKLRYMAVSPQHELIYYV